MTLALGLAQVALSSDPSLPGMVNIECQLDKIQDHPGNKSLGMFEGVSRLG